MAKVKNSYSKTLVDASNSVVMRIVWDIADDAEGYGVVIGDDNTDETIAFGQGDLAYRISGAFYQAVVNELESLTELPNAFDFDGIFSLYDSEKEAVFTTSEELKELQKILNYIEKWQK